MKRKLPNIIITGTPGTGKSTHCEQVVERMKGLMKHISVNQIVKDEACHEGWDSEFGCWIVDDDKVCFLSLPEDIIISEKEMRTVVRYMDFPIATVVLFVIQLTKYLGA